MLENKSRYYSAVRRNLSELERALSYRNAVNELYRVASTTCWSLFSYTYLAMYDAMFFHIIKILDEHRDAASFWYLWRCKPKIVERLLLAHNLTLDEVKKLSKKLTTIRDKTYFHIDKSDVLNPKDVWDRANIIWNSFHNIIDSLWNVLNDLYREQFDLEFNGQIYTGFDIEEIIKSLKEKGITI